MDYITPMDKALIFLVGATLLVLLSCDAWAKEIQGKDDQGRDYWLYVPDTIDPDKTYTLVVGVHGYRGKGQGAAGMAGWVKQHDVIVLGPTYDSEGYQYLQKGSDQQTLDLIEQLRKEYKLHGKIFIAGFSGGSQYASRFAMKYPGLVAGCAAHSGGTWGTGDYDRAKPNPEAAGVLFAISCGEKDTGKSFPQAPMGRLEWAKKYAAMLEEGGFLFEAEWVPDVGHRYAQAARQMTEDCFLASPQLLPVYQEAVAAIRSEIEAGGFSEAWKQIAGQERTRKPRQREGLIALVYQSHLEEIAALAKELDAIGVAQVAEVMASDGSPEEKTNAVRRLMHTHRDGPHMREAAKEALLAVRKAHRGEASQ